jgi:hypothetical protein
MHPDTERIAAGVRAAPDLAERLGALHGAYEGQRCVIVTCGPSLGDVPAAELRRALDGTLTIAVKQAIDTVGTQADFLCFNSFNVTRYRPPSPTTIRCLVEEPTGSVPQFNRADLRFPQGPDGGLLDRSLASTLDFDGHHLADLQPRPWGPGIMYELVFHLSLHLGVGEIITIGWDIGDDKGRNTHFYDTELSGDAFDRDRGERVAAATLRSHLPDVTRRWVRWGRAVVRHSRGQLYNHALPVQGEAERVAASTAGAADWLSRSGVRLAAVTPSQHLAPGIDRLDLDQLFERLASR